MNTHQQSELNAMSEEDLGRIYALIERSDAISREIMGVNRGTEKYFFLESTRIYVETTLTEVRRGFSISELRMEIQRRKEGVLC